MGYLNIDHRSTRIYVSVGLKTDMSQAIKNAQALEGLVREPVGMIVNGTQGFIGDIQEYLPHEVSLADALNEYTYRTLNDKGPTLIVTHSAGNNDATKAMQFGAQLGNSYPNLSLLSLASPIAGSVMTGAASNAGVNYLGQVNDWRDPVTNPKLWIAGTGMLAVGGLAAGIAAAPVTGGGSLYSYFSALFGAGVGGGVGLYGIQNYHPMEKYIAKPQSKSIMFDWQRKHQQ